MSSQRLFDAGDMYWTCEDLIIDDEAENYFLLSGRLAPWRWSMQASGDFYVSLNADDCVFLSRPGSPHSQIIISI